MNNSSIGGYFELELRQGEHFHKNAIKLNTARNCLEYVIRVKKYSKIYIPYYTCEVMLEPLKKCKVDYEFYSIDKQLDPQFEYLLNENEAFLYTNYFGFKNKTVTELVKIYQNQLIVDNSQAFYAKPVHGIDTFYSARKFFGVPDGAYLYTDKYLPDELGQDSSYTRMGHLLKRIDINSEDGYVAFRNNDDSLINQPILKMSKLTDRLLKSVDYEKIMNQRIQNYSFLEKELSNSNNLKIPLDNNVIPMVYPYLSKKKGLRQFLIENKIYIPIYWENVKRWTNKVKGCYEKFLVDNLICLPIDQRYNKRDLLKILNLVQDLQEK
jgi:hypothetical protein